MPEFDDLSGPFNPNLKFEDFSKEFLLKIMGVWQFAWLQLTESWYKTVEEKHGFDTANEYESAAWLRMAKRVNYRYPQIGNFEVKTVLDSLKAIQLPLDNVIGGLFVQDFDIKNPNHVIVTTKRCRSLEHFERNCPEKIQPVCHEFEAKIFAAYMQNPKLKITPLKLPPRKGPDDICCRWELKIEDED